MRQRLSGKEWSPYSIVSGTEGFLEKANSLPPKLDSNSKVNIPVGRNEGLGHGQR
jgi:hypothetical protein